MEEKGNWYEGVPAPMDADGNVVPLTTGRLYDGEGNEHEVKEIILAESGLRGGLAWWARWSNGAVVLLDFLRVAPPDSWERVEADLMAMARADCACYYFGAGADLNCEECPVENCAESCFVEAARDVLRRCKAIAGWRRCPPPESAGSWSRRWSSPATWLTNWAGPTRQGTGCSSCWRWSWSTWT